MRRIEISRQDQTVGHRIHARQTVVHDPHPASPDGELRYADAILDPDGRRPCAATARMETVPRNHRQLSDLRLSPYRTAAARPRRTNHPPRRRTAVSVLVERDPRAARSRRRCRQHAPRRGDAIHPGKRPVESGQLHRIADHTPRSYSRRRLPLRRTRSVALPSQRMGRSPQRLQPGVANRSRPPGGPTIRGDDL